MSLPLPTVIVRCTQRYSVLYKDHHGALYVSFLANCTQRYSGLYKDHHGALYVSFLANCILSSRQLQLSRCTLRICISSPTITITVHSRYLSFSTAFFPLVTATITMHSTYHLHSSSLFQLNIIFHTNTPYILNNQKKPLASVTS